MGCWPRRAGASSAAGCCPPAWWSITCWRWRCFRRALGWVRSRCRCCLPRLLGRWRPRTRRGRGIGGGGCWRWMGPRWTWPIPPTTRRRSAGPRAGGGRHRRVPGGTAGGLTECGTHATIKAAMGSYATGETTLAGRLLGELEQGALAGVLLLADRLFVGFELWRTAGATGAELVWRAKTGKTAPTLPVDQVLSDGSRLYAASDRRKRDPVVVRVVEYAICDPGRPQAKGVTYRLVTTILD